jgi:hypothetical protein
MEDDVKKSQGIRSTPDSSDSEHIRAELDDDDDELTLDDDQPSGFKGWLNKYWRHKKWTLPVTAVAVVLLAGGAVMAFPTTRYQVLGLFIKQTFTVTVTDSTTATPVSAAKVTLGGATKSTDSAGKASLTVPVGNHTLTITKTYYKEFTKTVLVDVTAGNNKLSVKLVATGRQVPVKVVNKITGKPIPEAVITAGGGNAKTDLNGTATIVLPTTATTQDATITVDGYNDLKAKVQVTTQVVDANTFTMVRAGRMYFLSNLSGKIDVVSTNLDGSDRKTVLEGTGKEDPDGTSLLASRDWKYLVLLSKRDGGDKPKLYLITTGGDKLTTLDSTTADFSLIGWSDHYFMYQISRPDVHSWQSNATSYMSYNADSNKSITLVSTSATGTSDADAQYETLFQNVVIGGNLVYAKTWYRYPGYIGVSGKQNVLASIKPDGTGAKTLKAVDAAQYYVSSLKLANPAQMYFAVFDNNSTNANYYRLDANGNITQSSTITNDSVNKSYPTYLASPSGKSTFWREARDGKNALFVGDANGGSSSQIATLSDYSPYGWYTDDYLLVQKNNSELYIMSNAGGTPLKLSDYYKPDYSYFGYGGGYGGL